MIRPLTTVLDYFYLTKGRALLALAVFLAIAPVFSGLLSLALPPYRADGWRTYAGQAETASPVLGQTTRLGQAFTAGGYRLDRLGLSFATYLARARGQIEIRLLSGSSTPESLAEAESRTLHRTVIEAETIDDNALMTFDLPEQAGSKGRDYYLFISRAGDPGSTDLSVWLNRAGLWPEAELLNLGPEGRLSARPAGGQVFLTLAGRGGAIPFPAAMFKPEHRTLLLVAPFILAGLLLAFRRTEKTVPTRPLGETRLGRFFLAAEYGDLRPVLAWFVLLAAIFYADKVLLGPGAPFRFHDTFDVFPHRWHLFAAGLFKQGLPIWDPAGAGGFPAYALHVPPYYPWLFAALVLPAWAIHSLAAVTLMIMAGLGAYLLLRNFIKLDHWPALAGGSLYALAAQVFGGHVFFNFNYTFPLFLAVGLGLTGPSKLLGRWWARLAVLVFIAAISLPGLTLAVFSAGQVLLLVLVYFGEKRHLTRLLAASVVLWTGYALFHLPTIYALLQFGPLSQRLAAVGAYYQDFPAAELLRRWPLTALDLTLMTGTLVLLLTSLAGLRRSARIRRSLLLVALLLGAMLLLRGPWLGSWPAFIQALYPDRVRWLLPVALTITACLSLDRLSKQRPGGIAAGLGVSALAATALVLAVGRAGLLAANLLAATGLGCLAWLAVAGRGATGRARPRPATLALVAVLCLAGAGLGFRTARSETEHDIYYQYFEKQPALSWLGREIAGRPLRVAAPGLPPATVQSYGLETVETRSHTQFGKYKELFKRIIGTQFESPEEERVFDTYPYNLYLCCDKHRGPGRGLNTALLQMMNVGYLASRIPLPQVEALADEVRLFDNGGRPVGGQVESPPPGTPEELIYVYRLKHPFDRAFLTSEPALAETDESALETLAAMTLDELRQGAVVTREEAVRAGLEPESFDSRSPAGTARITEYQPTLIRVEVEAAAPAILVVTNNFHPNWRAVVNGKPALIFRADHAFQGLAVGPGRSEVVLRYEDRWLWMSHLGLPAGLGLMALAVGMTRPGRRDRLETDSGAGADRNENKELIGDADCA